MCDIVCTIQDIASSLHDLKPPSLSHHTHYIWHRVQCICVITSTLLMISHQLYLWDHIHYKSRDHIHCIRHDSHMTSYTLCMTTQHCVLLIPHSAYVWHPLHCRWHHIHSIERNHSIYDVTSTLGMTSHSLCQTLHPLYLCHHNLSNDITQTFEWHHTHLLCDIICAIYNITSNP